jgi:hypothetical protein
VNDRDRYLNVIGDVHREWATREQPQRFAPDEHPDHSDYNVEVLEIEATGAQYDELEAMTVAALEAEGLAHLHPM